jgi:hypothetical protein
MNLLRKYRAKINKVPFTIKRYWQAYYFQFNSEGRLLHGGSPVKFSNDAKTGDCFPVIEKDGKSHCYKVTGIGRAAGSDHIASPMEFDLEYVKSK